MIWKQCFRLQSLGKITPYYDIYLRTCMKIDIGVEGKHGSKMKYLKLNAAYCIYETDSGWASQK